MLPNGWGQKQVVMDSPNNLTLLDTRAHLTALKVVSLRK